MSANATLPIVGQGRLLVRMHLRKAKRQETDPAKQKAIDAALADPDFVDNLTDEGIAASGNQVGGNMPALLQWLVANLPQIIALIMSLFGGA